MKETPSKRSSVFNPSFVFEETCDQVFEEKLKVVKDMAKQGTTVDLDSRIKLARRKRAKTKDEEGFPADSVDSVGLTKEAGSAESEDGEAEFQSVADIVRDRKKSSVAPKKKRKDDFFDASVPADPSLTFEEMNLSRVISRAISSMGYVHPTPVQSACIPIALLGKDVCVCAATGTGKTAAYIIPVLERLLFRPVGMRMTRVLVLLPTRELAIQVYDTAIRLAQFTNITFGLSSGGMNVKSQEAMLRLCPDVVLATPGRLIDHLRNSPTFNLSSVEILILDEADRMLDEYFAEQMNEVLRLCSPTRQTMLFSATMSNEVKDLAAVSLRNPVKLFVNENTEFALNLHQEFVRIRSSQVGSRESILLALLKRSFRDHVLLFVQTRVLCHRLRILLGLAGVNVGELHGKLAQAQRLDALGKFRKAETDVLIATDVAARGIDVEGVKTVINFSMPFSFKQYLHRVGRTARAGRTGKAVSLITEEDRKLLKEIVKHSKTTIKQRVISREVLEHYRNMVIDLEEDVKRIMEEEERDREIAIAERQMKMISQQLTSNDNPANDDTRKRTWFQSEQERKEQNRKVKELNKRYFNAQIGSKKSKFVRSTAGKGIVDAKSNKGGAVRSQPGNRKKGGKNSTSASKFEVEIKKTHPKNAVRNRRKRATRSRLLFYIRRAVTMLYSLSPKYDEGNAIRNLFTRPLEKHWFKGMVLVKTAIEGIIINLII
uniref:RNA helicase n=1 Tax=Trichuris muris TaxID=70415 RepID=A0A5S6QF71_TRIMR